MEWLLIVSHAINTKISYLNRVGSRIARPDRSEYEIGSSDCTSIPTASELLSISDIVRVSCCTILVFSSILEARELATLRVREALKRTLFRGSSTWSSLSGRFFDRTVAAFASFTRMRCVRRSSTSWVRLAASVAFYALWVSRIACLSAFSRASSSRAAWRIN